MKKIIFAFLIIIMALCLFACKKKEAQKSDIAYTINLSQEENIVKCSQSTEIANVYCKDLDSLTFNLYANAYREDALNKAYTEKLSSYGGIDIVSVSIGGNRCQYTLSDDKSFLFVTIPALALKDVVVVDMEYSITLPKCNLRMGISGNAVKLANFYPQLAVYGEDGFRKDVFSAIGDPIFSEAADYKVSITVPENSVVASSGSLISEERTLKGNILKYFAGKIRDFAMVIDSNLKLSEVSCGDTKILYYHYDDPKPNETLKYAFDALTVFNESFGSYPYETLSIVMTDYDLGGMEFGRLVYIANDISDIEGAIVHEIAHQWWYGIVGSDCINDAYLDEGLTTYSTLYYYKKIYGQEKFDACVKNIVDSYVLYERIQTMRKTGSDLSINKSIYDFTSYQYDMLVYKKGAMMFNHIMKTMGEEKFNKALKGYASSNSYKIADSESLISALNKEYGSDIGGIVRGWLGSRIKSAVFYAS